MRTSPKQLPFSTIVITLTVAALLLPWDAHCFGHPALPIPNSRPSRERFSVLSGPDAPTSSREAAKLYISKFDKSFSNEKPPSQIESIVANAKSLSASLFSRNLKLTNPTRQREVMTALTAGLAVSLAMVPEAVSFSFVAGVSPLVGLWTTVVLGFFAAAFGDRAGICSSASGACSVVVAALCASHGPGYLAGCAALAGILQIVAGSAGMGKLIRLVPHPVMVGFVNGLTLVMLKAQLTHFQSAGKYLSVLSAEGRATYGCALLTMALVKFGIPKLQEKIEAAKAIPPTLGGVILSAMAAKYFAWPVKTLADVAGSETFRGGLAILPRLGLPSSFWAPLMSAPLKTVKIILPYAITMAAVGSIESLLTLQLLDGIVDDGKRGSTRKEVVGQGIGNLAAGLTGGIGGCALIGQSIINAQSGGGISRLSGMSMAIFLALGIVSFAPLLGQIPIVALAGVMLLVCQSTFSWSSLRLWGKIPKLDYLIILLVSYVTVAEDLAKAVLIGTITSALGFAWKQSTSISYTISTTSLNPRNGMPRLPNIKCYNLNGPLFFGSAQQFSSLFNAKEDPETIVIDFSQSRVFDHSALEAINNLADRYGNLGKRVYLRRLSSDCAKLLAKVHDGGLPPYEIIEVDPGKDPIYGIAEKSELYSDVPVAKAG
mmetsp:Transcript_28565/g.57273  ORF Transcript_28565/g.57273 Transcript_28565/m.57273 type:complete len:658 (+) Transcript_28565:358-2331(+)|eukprot:CAMPEP_0171378224 /NCGR_PEP_ID=MMETSP0879-20121228/23405_1 /TAXON_ID=67004 /ORGANISM="Thalassiosira weissflogii, Strain CCMP1336" /LENGTH=657 /DNA_ID=CAMNT_0011888585 /DNA_START=317 /DNA_END=2290 /DNA_ORIENTATION=+